MFDKTKKLIKKSSNFRDSSLKAVARVEERHIWQLDDHGIKSRMKRINRDFSRAFEILRRNTDTVTFFGSARFEPDNPYYKQASVLAKRISGELKLPVVSGGGGGIMEAANRGAHEACQNTDHTDADDASLVCSDSVAMTIKLPEEQVTNPYANYSADFYYFFSRKLALAYAARAYVFFPGGFGTMDEFFEILTLKQTKKIPNIPVILCGTDYWQPLLEFIDKTLYQTAATISKEDMNLYQLTDDLDKIVAIINSTDPHQLGTEKRNNQSTD